MARRLVVLLATMLLALTMAAPAAFGWANGADLNGNGMGDNGYGTHDWLLENAMTIAGSEGAWITEFKQTALFATDDPDDQRLDNNLHLFREVGIGRGAPTEIADLYYRAVEAYKVGDRAEAARCVGVLSHYYGDILQPFHTDYAALSNEGLHGEYEVAVDQVTGKPGQHPEWISSDGFQPVTDVRAKSVGAAYYSRARYPSLLGALKASGGAHMQSSAVTAITAQVMNRGSNDLADIIRTIPSAAGVALPPATIKAKMYKYYPAQKSKIRVDVTCLDAQGRPIEGAAVDISVPLKAGMRTYRVYTTAAGTANTWILIDAMPLMRKASVKVVSKSAISIASVVAPSATSATTWFMPTPILADGAAGIKTRMSTFRPKRTGSVTATTVIRNRAGKPVVGLPVTFTWKFKTGTATYKVVTNSSGVAKVTRSLRGAAKGYRVSVRAQTMSGGISRSSTATFIPQ